VSVRLVPFVSRLEGIFNIRNLYLGGEEEGGWAILFGCGNVIKA
jgi:hypothetical protein